MVLYIFPCQLIVELLLLFFLFFHNQKRVQLLTVPVQLNVDVPLVRGSQCDNLRDVLEGLSLSIKEEARKLDADRFLKV